MDGQRSGGRHGQAMTEESEGPPGADGGTGLQPRVGAQQERARKTRDDILLVAREEFAAHGLSGARVDAIAERTRTSERMISYHFGSKERLYLAVLEHAYAGIRRVEAELNLGDLHPAEAMRRIVSFTFDYDEANPDFIRLMTIEKIHRGAQCASRPGSGGSTCR